MARSISHQIGEIIGDFFEEAIIEYLRPVINAEGNYYLDYRHPRAARNNETLVKGVDSEGNEHRLDIVIEKDGSETQRGKPKAYIEVAWRRYKKHSKNKAQEIAGAILPLVRTNAAEMPFYSAVLAGEFTSNSIDQLRSNGFFVLYFSYDEICSLFLSEGVSIHWEEDTSESDLETIVHDLQSLDDSARTRLKQHFIVQQKDRLDRLKDELKEALEIVITEVRITPIHGKTKTLAGIRDAVAYITRYNEETVQPLMRYEISIRYSNEQEYTMRCNTKRQAVQFLNNYVTD